MNDPDHTTTPTDRDAINEAPPEPIRRVPTGRSIIACRHADPDDASIVFSARNPATAVVLPSRFQAATRTQVNDAANRAWSAFDEARQIPAADRARLLELIATELERSEEDLLRIAEQETGLQHDRLATEFERTTGTLRMFAGVIAEGSWQRAAIDSPDPRRRPTPKPGLRRILIPVGPVAVFGASNFPLAYSTIGTDSASALAAGCPVIVKGHPLHPGTGEIAAQAVTDAVRASAFPDGWFSFLHAGASREHEIGAELLEHPCVRASGFTGSVAGGNALAKIAAGRPDPIPFFAEMGATNPVFVLPGGLAREPVGIAQHLSRAIGQYAGQQCTSPGLIFLLKGSNSSSFIERLARELAGFPPTPMAGARIRKNYYSRLESLLAHPGVRTEVGDPKEIRGASVRISEDRPTQEKPILLRTNADTFLSQPTLHEEVFGPASVVVECDDVAQAIQCAGQIQGTLTASIFLSSEDLPAAEELVTILAMRAGRIVFNGVPTGVEVGHATVHGGPFPASNRQESTAVGPGAIERWCRPVSFQNAPANLLPPDLRDENPNAVLRMLDGEPTREPRNPARG